MIDNVFCVFAEVHRPVFNLFQFALEKWFSTGVVEEKLWDSELDFGGRKAVNVVCGAI